MENRGNNNTYTLQKCTKYPSNPIKSNQNWQNYAKGVCASLQFCLHNYVGDAEPMLYLVQTQAEADLFGTEREDYQQEGGEPVKSRIYG